MVVDTLEITTIVDFAQTDITPAWQPEAKER